MLVEVLNTDESPTPLASMREAGFAGLVTKQKGRLSRPFCCASQRGGARGKPGFPREASAALRAARRVYIMPPISGMPAPAPTGFFSGGSATTASVVRMFFAIDA